MYKTIVLFTDLQDHSFQYLPGDIFPRKGLKVSEARIKELSTTANRRGIALIEAVPEENANVDTAEKFSEDMNPPVEPIEEAEAESEEAEEKPKAARGRKKKETE